MKESKGNMELKEKLDLIKSVGEEIITEDELKRLLETKENPIAYDGFEPSGKGVHIAQGLMRAINVNKLTKAGIKFKMLVADWHAMANNKLGGNLSEIQMAGKFMIEIWKACGMDLKNVEFIWANDLVKDPDYWHLVVQIARQNTVKRITRCAQIMGRTEKDALQASQILYPCMQAADIFYLKADIAQLGMDQRKVNVLAREIAAAMRFEKPVIISHHMLMGLAQPPKKGLSTTDRAIELKMSKSKPDTAIFMTDSLEEVEDKIKKAYCPEGKKDDNPILEYFKHIIFEKEGAVKIERPEKFGGNLSFDSYEGLEKLFVGKELHPMDLKSAAAKYINKMLEPVREHFKRDKKAHELMEVVKTFDVTR